MMDAFLNKQMLERPCTELFRFSCLFPKYRKTHCPSIWGKADTKGNPDDPFDKISRIMGIKPISIKTLNSL